MNDLSQFRDTVNTLKGRRQAQRPGFRTDFVGVATRAEFVFDSAETIALAKHGPDEPPTIGDGDNAEGWFEAINWIEAARAASGHYTMITLGAAYGGQAVAANAVLQAINPMPSTLVFVEPEPGNFQTIIQHLRDNGLDPDEHWLINTAISDSVSPVLFPVGATGSGSQNCFATDEQAARANYVAELSADAPTALRNLLLHNTTGLTKTLVEGKDFTAEIKMVSAITLRELLGPFKMVDYLESDIQQSEIRVFPPYVDLLRKKVRRIHIGTHGGDVHRELHDLFVAKGWEIIFSFAPNETHQSALGTFTTNDGVLTVRNPDLS